MRRTVLASLGILVFIFAAPEVKAQAPNTIVTVAGGGTNSGAGNTWTLTQPPDAVRDTAGNTYISDPILCVVYKVTTAGTLSVYAGNGIFGVAGDGGPATSAGLSFPQGLAFDANDNLYIADFQNNRVRRVDATTHVITTVAGSGDPFTGAYAGDGGLATLARLSLPYAVAIDANGNLFISDAGNNVVRRVDALTQVITTYAGNGLPGTPGSSNGDGGAATSAQLNNPIGLAVGSNGNLYISDSNDSVIRVVNAQTQIISTYAGSPAHAGSFSGDGGAATSAGLNSPSDIFLDGSGGLYIADASNDRVRFVDTSASHIITTFAGGATRCMNPGSACGDGAAATSALLNHPTGVFLDGLGNLLISDYGDQRVRVVTGGIISNFGGGATGGDGGAATSAILGLPNTVAVDSAGNVYFMEQYGERVRKVDAATQKISTIAGTGARGQRNQANGDGGQAVNATFVTIFGFTMDSAGNFYLADVVGAAVRKIDTTGKITTIAGNGLRCGEAGNPNTNGNSCGDGGQATSASLLQPAGVAVDSQGNIYISDLALNRIRMVNANGIISNFAGTGAYGYSGDEGDPQVATMVQPFALAIGPQDALYFADSGNNVIRRVANQTISTVAFNGLPGFSGDGGSALEASMTIPQQVAVDSSGNLYIGGGLDNVVRRVDAQDQSIITVAGDIENLAGGFAGDGGPSTKALLGNLGAAIDASHNLYIADGFQRVRKVNLRPVTTELGTFTAFPPTLLGTNVFTAPSQSINFSNSGLDDLILTITSPPANSAFQVQEGSCGVPCTIVIPPGESADVGVTFAPGVGTPTGPIAGTLVLTTNDPANPSFSFSLSGTATNTPETLMVTVTPAGAGTVTSDPFAIDCTSQMGTTCSANFAQNAQVTLSQFPNTGFAFTGWSGAGCSGTNDCVVPMTQAQNVTATYSVASGGGTPTTVSALGNGSGTITSNPAGINCTYNGTTTSGTCSFTFPGGTTFVTMTATPSVPGSTFAGWLGYCGVLGTDTCQTIAGIGVSTTAVFSVPPQAFTQGEVFAGAAGGMIFVYKPNGTLAQVLGSGNIGGNIGGIAFDTSGNLYAANPTAQVLDSSQDVVGTVERFGSDGSGPTTFGTGPFGNGYAASPQSIVVSPAGKVYVAQSGGRQSLLQFPAAGGTASQEFFPPDDTGPIQWIELLDDNNTMLYTTSGNIVKAFDVLNNYYLPDFAMNLPGPAALGLRELPDRTLLVADGDRIVRLSASGAVMQTYLSGIGIFHSVNLDPDGATFWTLEDLQGTMYRINIASGTTVSSFSTGVSLSLDAFNGFDGGIAVFGQPQSGGADVQVTMTASASSVMQNSNLTYTIVVKNNGALSAANVAMTDAFPSGVSFVSSATTQGTCTGTLTVTCNLGTMANGASATMTIVVTPTTAGTLVNTANVTSTTPDPVTFDNTAMTSTTVIAAAATHFSVTAPGTATAGTAFNFTVTALDSMNNTATGYTGTVHFTSSDGAAILPANSTLTNGTGTFSATLETAGSRTITATDTVTGSITGTSGAITVSATTFTLAVTTAGSGTGTVTGSGINCTSGSNTGCTVNLAGGTAVTLTEAGTNGSTFAGWVGAPTTCNVSGATCTFTMPAGAEAVTANFNAAAGGGPSFDSTVLPSGALTVPYGADIQVSGGAGPYTFAVANGSNLPAGFTLGTTANGTVAAGHIFSNSPAATGTFTFGIKVTDSTTPTPQTATATISLTIGAAPPNTQASLLNGPYALMLRGFETSGAEDGFIGSLTFDGVSHVTGVVDANSGSGGIQEGVAVTGTYSIGPDNRGVVVISNGANTPLTLTISVGGIYRGAAAEARITQFNNNDGNDQIGSGMLLRQDPTAFNQTSLQGTYVTSFSGQDPEMSRVAFAGLVQLDNNLNIVSGSGDVNDGGSVSSITSITGQYAAPNGTTGRYTFNVTVLPGGDNFTRVAYIVSQNEFFVMTTDARTNSELLIGPAVRQANPGTFSGTSIKGPDILHFSGLSITGGYDSVVALTSVTGNTLTVKFDENDGGTLYSAQTLSGTLTVAANGRASVQLGGETLIMYLVSPDRGFMVGSGAGSPDGQLDPQVGAPFSGTPLTSSYYFGQDEALGASGSQFSGIAALASPGVFNTTDDESHSGGNLFYDQNIGTLGFSVDATGHITSSQPGTTGDLTGYAISPFEFVFFDTNGPTSDPSPSNHPNLVVSAAIAAPAGQPSPAGPSVNFPTPVSIGASAQSAPITITNTGLGPLGFTGQNTGNSPDFSASGTCLAAQLVVIQPQGTCTLIVTFAPTAGTSTGVPLAETLGVTTDGGNISIAATGTAAASGAATHFMVSAPSTATSGTAFNFTVTALTASNTTATGYQSTVNFTSTDGAAQLPSDDVGLTNGVGTFSATLNTIGGQTITVTDTETPSITGTSGTITVSAVATPQLVVTTAGTGTGTVTGAGINCTSGSANGCTASVTAGTQVTLTATAGGNSTFTNWSAVCPNMTSTTCTFTMPATSTMVTATFTLNPATLRSIAVTPTNPTEPINSSLQFHATGTYSDNTTKDITGTVTWSSSNTEAATINASGLASTGANADSSTTISATLDDVVGSTLLTLTNSPIVVTVTPPPGGSYPPVPPGGQLAVGIVLTSIPGFTGTVTFGCTTSSPTITCQPNPASVTLTPGGPTQVAIVVNTYCTGNAAPLGPNSGGPGGGLALLLLSLMMGSVAWIYRRNPRWVLSFAVLLLIALGGAACSSLPKGPNGATPPGNYTLTFSATVNGTTTTTPPIPFTVE